MCKKNSMDTTHTLALGVYEELRRFMKEKKITGRKLAGLLGCSTQSISSQLTSGRLFSLTMAQRWANAFSECGQKINTSFLVTGEGHLQEVPEGKGSYSFIARKSLDISVNQLLEAYEMCEKLKKENEELKRLNDEYVNNLFKQRDIIEDLKRQLEKSNLHGLDG